MDFILQRDMGGSSVSWDLCPFPQLTPASAVEGVQASGVRHQFRLRVNKARNRMQKVKGSSHYPGRKIAQRMLDNSLWVLPSVYPLWIFIYIFLLIREGSCCQISTLISILAFAVEMLAFGNWAEGQTGTRMWRRSEGGHPLRELSQYANCTWWDALSSYSKCCTNSNPS